METDKLFWQLFKQLPETLFELLGLPASQAKAYRFDAVEIKKSFRLDGLFIPTEPNLPLYFVEVQFHHNPKFYPNLFAKVFTHLATNDERQDWRAVALFADRGAEPATQTPYEELLASARVRRFYLDELPLAEADSPGLKILQLLTAPKRQTPELAAQLVKRAQRNADCENVDAIVELAEQVLMRRFTELNREGIRKMLELHDIRESRAWQEIHEEGVQEGSAQTKQETARRLLKKRMPAKEIAELLDMPLAEVRRLARKK